MSHIGKYLRYHLRSLAFRNTYVRRAVLHGASKFSHSKRGSSKEYWDLALGGELKTYLGGTVSIDSRNALVAVLIDHYAPAIPCVLDIGCAGGSLARILKCYSKYLGVDISSLAAEQARQDPKNLEAVRDGKMEYVASDMCELSLETAPKWDVILFNEVLYYLTVEEAVRQVARYCATLREGGIVCVSMKDDGKAHAVFDCLAREYTWKEGLLWQSKIAGPDYRIGINRERPAYLLAALAPRA